jgi:hypothetical protein
MGQVPLPGAIDRFDSSLNLNQDVTVSVLDINSISVSGNVTLTFISYTSGLFLDDVVDASTTYNITVNGASKKITAALDAAYAPGISLFLLLTVPGTGTPIEQTLSTTGQDVLIGFGKLTDTSVPITYTARASILVAENGTGESRTVTLTLSDN